MIHLPIRSKTPRRSPYEGLGLTDQPFPTEPVVNPYSQDARRNGTIYATSPVSAEIEKFERLLIRSNDFPNRAKLAYLWSKGDQHSGRGMGKTALLRYFRQRINKDWGHTEFDGQFSAVVVYVSFTSQVDRRYMEQLALAALVDICKNGVLKSSRAALRLEAMTPEQQEAVMTFGGVEPNPSNLLEDSILESVDISPSKLDDVITNLLTEQGIGRDTARHFAQGTFEDHLRSFRKDGNLEPLYIPRDTRILDYSRGFLFDDVVLYLRAAGFAGGYLFIDDIENLVDQMTRKHRIEFAKEFGLCTVRPGYANTTYNFFSCVLTTHQQASIGLSQAWGDAGLSAIARLDPGSPNSIELPLPSKDQARKIIVAHLDNYRIDDKDNGTIKPFTDDGIDALVLIRQHPRDLLASASTIIVEAMQQGATSIDAMLVKAVLERSAAQPAHDFSEGIEDAM